MTTILMLINISLLGIAITLQLLGMYLKTKKTSKTEENLSLEPTPQNDIETLMIEAEDKLEAEKAIKEAEEKLQLKAYGLNTALAETLEEIMEGVKSK